MKVYKNFFIFTGSRAEFYLLKELIDSLLKNNFTINLIVSDESLDNELKSLNKNKNLIFIKAYIEKTTLYKKKQISDLVNLFNSKLKRKISYKKLIIYGDRIEAFAMSIVAFQNSCKIVHIGGGDETPNSLDNYFRNSITSMSNIHFVTNKFAKNKVMNFTKSKDVYNFGYLQPSILPFHKKTYEIFQKKFIYKRPYFLITYHPNSLSNKNRTIYEINNLLNALENFRENFNFIFTAPNKDENSDLIKNKIISFVNKNKNISLYEEALGQHYQIFLKNTRLALGNSSSIVYETVKYGTPALLIGNRQMGRELQKNIHHVGNEKNEIIKIIKNIVSCVKNINELKSGYHKKNTANNISTKLKEVFKNE